MILYLLIALGSGLGGMARFALTGFVNQSTGGGAFPWGTIAVNVIGSFIIGFFCNADGPRRTHAGGRERTAVFHDGRVGRFHDVFLVQPANADAGPRGRITPGRRQCVGERGALPRGGVAGASHGACAQSGEIVRGCARQRKKTQNTPGA